MNQQPHNIEAEKGLLGVLMMPESANVLAACFARNIQPDAFYDRKNRIVWAAIAKLGSTGEEVDEMRVIDFLTTHTAKDLGWLRADSPLTPPDMCLIECVGGPAYLMEMTTALETTTAARQWLNIIVEKWQCRQIITHAQDAIRLAHAPGDETPDDIRARLESALTTLDASERQTSVSLATAMEKALVDRQEALSKAAGVRTGFLDLDVHIRRGFEPKQFIVIAARSGAGKSALAACVAYQAVTDGIPTKLFTLEMGAEEFGDRINAIATEVDQRRISEQMATPAERYKLKQAIERISHVPAEVDDGNWNIEGIWRKARDFRRRHCRDNRGMIIIDYLQLVRPSSPRDSREQQVAHIARSCKAMAKELHMPVVGLAQLNRGKDRYDEPNTDLLRESAALEHDADKVLLLWEDAEDKHIRKIKIAKQRGGPTTGPITLGWRGHLTKFFNHAKDL